MSLFTIKITCVVKQLAADVGLDSITVDYVIRRAKFEGLAFLTVTLPKLSKSVVSALETGVFERPSDFAWKGKSLRYFRSFLDRIFDSKGALLTDPCPLAIAQLRQFCEYFYKLANAATDKQKVANEQNYLRIEEDCSSSFWGDPFVDAVRKNIETHYNLSGSSVVDVFQHTRPRFGPGAFFGSEKADNFAEYKLMPSDIIGTARLDQAPFSGYFRSYPSSKEKINLVQEGRTSAVLFVPKDSRGPRTISKEPLHLLKGQMSFFGWMSSLLERSTRFRINFLDQRKNRDLALQGSIDRRWSTLDLKDASDRVSLALCRVLFQNIPSVRYFITHFRSTHTQLPSGREIRLKKLSGMGSGITFPILALTVHASICTSIVRSTSLEYNYVSRNVYVYGDDVIVPNNWYNAAVSGLNQVGLRVNLTKSFTKGFFRESCGGDYFRGQNVTPVRLRLAGVGLGTPDLYRSGEIRFGKKVKDRAFLQLERHCRELWTNGLTNLSRYYYGVLEKVFGPLPMVSGNSAVLGIYNPLSSEVPVMEQLGYVPSSVILKSNRVSPHKYLGHFLLKEYDEPWVRLFSPGRADVFGEVALPRRLKIRKKLASYVDLTLT
jgi:hypothetical protein